MKKILITKDIYSFIENEVSFLNREDLALYAPSSKDEVISIHMKEHVDLIVFDIDAPGMSSEQLCSLIRNDPEMRRVSIIAVSSDMKLSGDKLPDCNANEFIMSPYSPSALLDKAHELLNVSKRANFRAPLGVKIKSDSNNGTFVCYSENISSSGMLIQCDNELKEGDVMKCGFYLPDNSHIVSEAVVVRNAEKHKGFKSGKYGIRFTDIKEELSIAIDKYVKSVL